MPARRPARKTGPRLSALAVLDRPGANPGRSLLMSVAWRWSCRGRERRAEPSSQDPRAKYADGSLTPLDHDALAWVVCSGPGSPAILGCGLWGLGRPRPAGRVIVGLRRFPQVRDIEGNGQEVAVGAFWAGPLVLNGPVDVPQQQATAKQLERSQPLQGSWPGEGNRPRPDHVPHLLPLSRPRRLDPKCSPTSIGAQRTTKYSTTGNSRNSARHRSPARCCQNP